MVLHNHWSARECRQDLHECLIVAESELLENQAVCVCVCMCVGERGKRREDLCKIKRETEKERSGE